jgi:hypothetical protein
MTRRRLNRVALTAGLVASLLTSACGGGGGAIEGTYESGMTRLTLHGGGKATFRLFDTDFDCTYTQNDRSITLNCPARDPANLTFNDDGSLVDPFVGVMKKVG